MKAMKFYFTITSLLFLLNLYFVTINEDISYVGSKSCLSCHEGLHNDIVAGWRKSAHSNTVKKITDISFLPGDFERQRFFKKENVIYVIGSGGKRRIYIDASLHLLEAEWLIKEREWRKIDAVDAGKECIGCHTLGYDVKTRKFQEPSVGCEACHGPGSEHVSYATLKEPLNEAKEGRGDKIVNPKKLPADLRRMVCGQCHSLGRDLSGNFAFPVFFNEKDPIFGWTNPRPYRPGDNLEKSFLDAKPKNPGKNQQYSLLVQSPSYYQLDCCDCHDPHGATKNKRMLKGGNDLCLRCHGIKIPSLVMHVPGAKEATCWECHLNTHTH